MPHRQLIPRYICRRCRLPVQYISASDGFPARWIHRITDLSKLSCAKEPDVKENPRWKPTPDE